ncbi:hypothetical protein TNCV_3404541 [Trichonephila clavipes]|nr:hypothetical protein TNCV_3404541 [Trichonephila clavipes]
MSHSSMCRRNQKLEWVGLYQMDWPHSNSSKATLMRQYALLANLQELRYRRTLLKFDKRIPFIEYRSPTEWVVKIDPKWRCGELRGVVGN